MIIYHYLSYERKLCNFLVFEFKKKEKEKNHLFWLISSEHLESLEDSIELLSFGFFFQGSVCEKCSPRLNVSFFCGFLWIFSQPL